MENHFSRYSKLTLSVLIFILSLYLSLTTVYGQGLQGQGSLQERLAQRGIDPKELGKRVKEVMQVQNRNRGLIEKFGVVGMGTGITPEGEAVIKVFTAAPGITGIPEKLEGVRVTTKVTGQFYALRDNTCDPSVDGDCKRWDRWPLPVPIGVSTGHPDITAGTIGARVKDDYGNVYALSNNHVYADLNNALINDMVLQPGSADGGIDPYDEIGTLDDFEPIDFCVWIFCFDNQIDAAIALSSVAKLGNATPADGYGAPESDIVPAEAGQSVMKYGRTSGLTRGTIDAINATLNVGYGSQTARFVNQIIVASNTVFIQGGDSGSLLVTDPGRNPVGLLYAGNQSGTSAIANRIDLVLNRFDVTIDSGAPPVLETISITPTSATIGIGETKQFVATGHYSDNSTEDLTLSVSWKSSVPGVATIHTEGLATGVSEGTAQITATQDGITSNEATLTVTATSPVLESITVAPTSATIGIQETKQFVATGHYSDNSTEDFTLSVSWESSNSAVATIDTEGLATGVSEGTAQITATHDEITSEPAILEVTADEEIYMHVGDLDGESKKWRWGYWKAIIDITIHDSNEQAVMDATVVGSFDDCPGGVDCEKFECTTDSKGLCTVVGWQHRSLADHLTFTVENVSHATLEYNPDFNHDPDGDSNPPGTSIYVPSPY
jgi:uncharacterized protein YjdB